MGEPLPEFRFYRDPVGDGTLVASSQACASCERRRGWIARSVLYGERAPDGAAFCPWCIAEGSTASRFGGTFNQCEPAEDALREEVERRTPNFDTWQDWSWPVHCRAPMIYLGQPSGTELSQYPGAIESLRSELADLPHGSGEEALRELIDVLGPGRDAVVYVFRCLRCGSHRAVWDSS